MRFERLAMVALALTMSSGGLGAEQADDSVPNAHRPEPNLLLGGQPSEAQLAALVEAGYRIIDLRPPAEERGFDEAAKAAELEADYVNIPVSGETLGQDETYERFFAQLERPEPTLVHCASGNRVGGLYYAYLVAAKGMPRAQAAEVAKANGMRSAALEQAVNKWLDARDAKPSKP